MSKFKVGDRVRRISGMHKGMSAGDESTVSEVYGHKHVALDSFSGEHWEVCLELADTSPIRTVTRREIVSGVYGIVSVAPNASRCAFVPKARDYTASDYREAAHLFNQLAEVLEENAAAEQKAAA